jgi:hypothetical protein
VACGRAAARSRTTRIAVQVRTADVIAVVATLLLGALAGLGATRAFTGEWSALVAVGAGAALLVAALAGGLAALVPAAVVRRLPTARLLAEE